MENSEHLRAKDSAYPFLFLFALLTLYVECFFFWQYVEEKISFQVFYLLHAYVTFFWLTWNAVLHFLSKEQRLSVVGLFLIFFLAPFGAISYVLILVVHFLNTRKTVSFSDWFAALFPEEDVDETERIYERIVFGLEGMDEQGEVEPFQDILNYGTLYQKQEVLSKIARHFKPDFSEILLNALNSKENAVRVQAASCLSKIENQYMEKYVDLQRKKEAKPDDLIALTDFGKFCMEYADSGILDEDREKVTRQGAIEAFRHALDLNEDCTKLKFVLGELYLKAKELKKAERFFNKCKKDKAIASSPDFVLLYMDVLFQLEQYSKLRKFAHSYKIKMDEEHVFYDLAREKLALWNGA